LDATKELVEQPGQELLVTGGRQKVDHVLAEEEEPFALESEQKAGTDEDDLIVGRGGASWQGHFL
jgi:hypothetical protein